MKWKNRSKQIANLKTKYRASRYKVPFPDLKQGNRAVAPTSDRFDSITDRSNAEPTKPNPPGILVDHFHKSGLQVILPSELPWAGGKKP